MRELGAEVIVCHDDVEGNVDNIVNKTITWFNLNFDDLKINTLLDLGAEIVLNQSGESVQIEDEIMIKNNPTTKFKYLSEF